MITKTNEGLTESVKAPQRTRGPSQRPQLRSAIHGRHSVLDRRHRVVELGSLGVIHAMWLYVDSPQHYFIEDLCDYRGFLRALHFILQPDDFIVFSSYDSRPDIRAFLEQYQLEPDEHVIHERKRLANYRVDHPDAFAIRCAAHPVMRDQLLQLLCSSARHSDFCDHIIAYGQRGALLSFHDAFQSDPLIVSDCVPKSQIDQFCELLGVSYKLQDRKVFYDWSK